MTTIGQPRKLDDGRAKVLGLTRYGTDQRLPRMLEARFVTSPHAHAEVRSIDADAALALPGVVRVLTAEDLPDVPPGSRRRLWLARGRAIFVGHPVALVLAEDAAAAEDGAEAVAVDYRPLPAAADMDQALAEDAPAVWSGGTPGAAEDAGAHGAVDAGGDGDDGPPNLAGEVPWETGDLAAGEAAAAAIVDHVYETAAVHQSYLEPHVTVAEPTLDTGGATVWAPTQAPFDMRADVAQALAVPESEVRIVPTPIGGGFGGKFVLYDSLVALAARAAGRPVRLILTRAEEMLAANPAPATRTRVRLGATAEGQLTLLDADYSMDCGCYPSSMVGLATMLLGSMYRCPNVRVVAREILTFKASTGAYRAPCAPQVAFALESAMDELAAELGIDPLELRRRNACTTGDPMALRGQWPSMGMREVLDVAVTHPVWTERESARAAGRGVGIAIGGWPGGTEPAAASCSLERDGTIHVRIGAVDLTGTDTAFALIAAEAFGLDPEQVRVVGGDTDVSPYAGAAGGSKTIYTVGPAVIQAAEDARRQTLELAAEMLEAAAEDLEIADGAVQVKGAPDQAVPLAKIAQRTMRFGGRYAPVNGSGRHANNVSSPGFCVQLAEVDLDRETGTVRVTRLAVIQDVGKAINPPSVLGQMRGGAAQGIGWGLREALRFDDSGQLLTASFMDYALPRFADVPVDFDATAVENPTPLGPFGARGVGEPPVIATAAAIANAVYDATGARVRKLPLTAEEVERELRAESSQLPPHSSSASRSPA